MVYAAPLCPVVCRDWPRHPSGLLYGTILVQPGDPFSRRPGQDPDGGDLLAHSHGFLLQDDLLTAVEDQASIQLTVPSVNRQIILDYQSQTLADYYVRLGETQLADHAPAGLNQTATVIDARRPS
jgi:hypothetical protein